MLLSRPPRGQGYELQSVKMTDDGQIFLSTIKKTDNNDITNIPSMWPFFDVRSDNSDSGLLWNKDFHIGMCGWYRSWAMFEA